MSLPKVILGLLGILVALVSAMVAGFSGIVNTLSLNIDERKLEIPPELEALYRQIDYETGVDWLALAAWDGAEYGFHLPVPSVAEIFAQKVQAVIEQREQDAEEYCELHPEDTINCPPGPVVLDPEELVQLWGAAYGKWRSLLRQHVLDHVDAIGPHTVALWNDPEPVYRLFLPDYEAALAAELFEGYLILDDLADSHDEILVPPTAPPGDWTPVAGFAWPSLGPISSRFGMRYSPIDGQLRLHGGIDLAVGTGTAVWATKSGTVMEAGFSEVYGRYVVLQHNGGYRSLYAHNSALAVSVGETVSQGEIIAWSGSTGLSTGPHLHFEIHYLGAPVDPLLLLTERVAEL